MRITPLSTSCAILLAFGLSAQKPTGPTTLLRTFSPSPTSIRGYIDNLGGLPRVVFTKTIKFAGTEWMNLQFGEAHQLA